MAQATRSLSPRTGCPTWPRRVAARLFWKLVKDKRCLAFNIFDALSPHTFAAA
jgi:hypothetical protein